MKVQILLHLLLVGVVISAPAKKSSKKFPKKFNKDLHSIGEKKDLQKSSYSSYKYVEGDTVPMLPPPPPSGSSYRDEWWSLVESGRPIFVHREDIQPPNPRISPPEEDSYSVPAAGPFMDELNAPPVYPLEEDQPLSYVVYVGERTLPLSVPKPWTYAAGPEEEKPTGSLFPSEVQQPPSVGAEAVEPISSSYSSV